jgi:hypothetical protein
MSAREQIALAISNEQLNLCQLVLGHMGESDDRSHWRTAVHEAGHAMVELLEGVDFARAVVRADGSGEVETQGLQAEYDECSLESRVATDLGGAVAEELVFNDVEPGGVETDLRVALARLRVTHPERVGEDDEGVAYVRAQVARVRAMLRRRRPALLKLAEALLRKRTLERRECALIVRAAGTRVWLRPHYSPIIRRGEARACDVARWGIEERRQELARACAVAKSDFRKRAHEWMTSEKR